MASGGTPINGCGRGYSHTFRGWEYNFVLGIGIGRLPGRGRSRQRLQFGGHGEAVTATGGAIGLQEVTVLRPAAEAGPFYYAEEHHQQYRHKVPNGYCPVHATGVRCG